MKKLLALIIALAMLAPLAACNKPVKNPPATPVPSSVTEPPKPIETDEPGPTESLKNSDIYPLKCDETFTIGFADGIPDFGEKGVAKLWERVTGVKINYLLWSHEQLQMSLSSKEMPDAYMFGNDVPKDQVKELGDSGYLINFMDYLDVMPNLAAIIQKFPNEVKVFQQDDGALYVLPKFGVSPTAPANLLSYRKDMAREAGWDKPPETTDEFLQFIKDIQEHFGKDNPNFRAYNGHHKELLEWDGRYAFSYFFPAFGELVEQWLTVDKNDKVVLGAATDQWKHFMEFMHEVYDSGAFTQDVYSMDEAMGDAMNESGNAAMSHYKYGFDKPETYKSGKLEMDYIPPLTSEYYTEQHCYMAPAARWNIYEGFNAVTSACKDIKTMCRWFDSMYAPRDNPLNKEGTVWATSFWLGELGVNFELDEENHTWRGLPCDKYPNGDWYAEEGYGTAISNGTDRFPYVPNPESGNGIKGLHVMNCCWPVGEQPRVVIANLTLTEAEKDIYNDAWADIDLYVAEMTARFITGEADIEATWEEYINTLNQMGLQDVYEVYQAAYDRSK